MSGTSFHLLWQGLGKGGIWPLLAGEEQRSISATLASTSSPKEA